MIHLIHYELKGYRPRAQYQRLEDAIKSISGTYCHLPESTWLVETELSTQAVSERLAPLTQIGDPIFVTRIYRDWHAYSLTNEQVSWLNARNFGSLADVLGSLPPLPVRSPFAALLPKTPPPLPSSALVSAILGMRKT